MKREFGCDMSKWLITQKRGPDGGWYVCPPVTASPDWYLGGAQFKTGTEALAAFASGGAA